MYFLSISLTPSLSIALVNNDIARCRRHTFNINNCSSCCDEAKEKTYLKNNFNEIYKN